MATEKQWQNNFARVSNEMSEHVKQFVTPLSMSMEHGSGTAWGSGTYVEGASLTWILTAEHVVSNVPAGGRLAHLPQDGGDYNAAFGEPAKAPWPIDAAALPIYPDQKYLPAANRIVPKSSIALNYAPVSEELLFWSGFPGYTSERNDPRLKHQLRTSVFEQLHTPAKPMLSQAIAQGIQVSASNFSPALHVAVLYPTTATRATDGETIPLPNAAGMSGSALWDTKFVACSMAGKPWYAERAEICGVVWAVLDDPEVVFVTKIEHIRVGLPGVF